MPPVSAIQRLLKPGMVVHVWPVLGRLSSCRVSSHLKTNEQKNPNVNNEAKDSYNLFPSMLRQTA